jgi:hypothetical protein
VEAEVNLELDVDVEEEEDLEEVAGTRNRGLRSLLLHVVSCLDAGLLLCVVRHRRRSKRRYLLPASSVRKRMRSVTATRKRRVKAGELLVARKHGAASMTG